MGPWQCMPSCFSSPFSYSWIYGILGGILFLFFSFNNFYKKTSEFTQLVFFALYNYFWILFCVLKKS